MVLKVNVNMGNVKVNVNKVNDKVKGVRVSSKGGPRGRVGWGLTTVSHAHLPNVVVTAERQSIDS